MIRGGLAFFCAFTFLTFVVARMWDQTVLAPAPARPETDKGTETTFAGVPACSFSCFSGCGFNSDKCVIIYKIFYEGHKSALIKFVKDVPDPIWTQCGL